MFRPIHAGHILWEDRCLFTTERLLKDKRGPGPFNPSQLWIFPDLYPTVLIPVSDKPLVCRLSSSVSLSLAHDRTFSFWILIICALVSHSKQWKCIVAPSSPNLVLLVLIRQPVFRAWQPPSLRSSYGLSWRLRACRGEECVHIHRAAIVV